MSDREELTFPEGGWSLTRGTLGLKKLRTTGLHSDKVFSKLGRPKEMIEIKTLPSVKDLWPSTVK